MFTATSGGLQRLSRREARDVATLGGTLKTPLQPKNVNKNDLYGSKHGGNALLNV
jgi:hypothetical protein